MKLQIEIAGRLREVELERGDSPNRYRAILDGKPIEFDAAVTRPGVLSLVLPNQAHRIVLENGSDEPAVYIAGARYVYLIHDPRSLKARRAHAHGHDGPRPIKASMPGRVVRLLAKRGDVVEAGQGVVVIEAMKMQNELKSPKEGKITELRVSAGDTVSAGDILAIIE